MLSAKLIHTLVRALCFAIRRLEPKTAFPLFIFNFKAALASQSDGFISFENTALIS